MTTAYISDEKCRIPDEKESDKFIESITIRFPKGITVNTRDTIAKAVLRVVDNGDYPLIQQTADGLIKHINSKMDALERLGETVNTHVHLKGQVEGIKALCIALKE